MEILKNVWDFFQNQILSIKWLNVLIGRAISAFGIDINSRIGGSIQFFLYDFIKIILLLSVFIFIISYIQSHFPPQKTKAILGKFKGIKANLMGALLGTVTPFCSCSSIPLFIGFTSAGLPIGVTFSFLISSPLVDLAAFVILTSVFGFKIAIAYVVVGIILAVIGGTIIDKLKMEKHLEPFVNKGTILNLETSEVTRKDRLIYAKEQMIATVKKLAIYIVIGVGIGALIHNWIPTEFIQKILGEKNPFSVLIATIVGVPIYADEFGTIPIAEALFAKGVGIGTVLSFMMAVTALSLPSIIMLKKVVKPKLLGVFVGIVTVGIIIIGYTFNALAFLFK